MGAALREKGALSEACWRSPDASWGHLKGIVLRTFVVDGAFRARATRR
jgi:hypothetical protein